MSHRHNTRNVLLGSLLAVVIGAPMAVPAAAQSRAGSSMASPVTFRADALHERAVQLFESPRRYREAARLLREAAALRTDDDERGTDELMLSGRLSHYARDWSTARRTLDAAATRAVRNGEIRKAANAYVDAAFNALAQKKWNDALGFTVRAERLARSPHLQLAERDEILGRIRPVRVAAQSGR